MFSTSSKICVASLLSYLAVHAVGLQATSRLGKDGKLIVFIAGVEGAGHHAVNGLLHNGVIIHKDVQLPDHLRMKCHRHRPGALLGWTNESWIDDMVNIFRPLDSGHTYVLPSEESYPKCRGPHEKRRDELHPKAHWIAEAAAQVDADFRVLLLLRPFEECLVASCMHRDFESCPDLADTLLSNAKILIRQLMDARITKSKVTCLNYAKVESVRQSLADVFGEKNVKEEITKTWKPTERNETEYKELHKQIPHWKKIAAGFAALDAEYAELCS